MSIASIRQSNEERYQRHTLASNSQATWTYENYYDLDDILATNEHVLYHFEPETPKGMFFL
jgi:hypothetical protein